MLFDGLTDYFELLPRKYDSRRLNTYHILKSLTYFTDAAAEPMPQMKVPFDWEKCKAFFIRQARSIVLPSVAHGSPLLRIAVQTNYIFVLYIRTANTLLSHTYMTGLAAYIVLIVLLLATYGYICLVGTVIA